MQKGEKIVVTDINYPSAVKEFEMWWEEVRGLQPAKHKYLARQAWIESRLYESGVKRFNGTAHTDPLILTHGEIVHVNKSL
jgi:hypothetical protein